MTPRADPAASRPISRARGRSHESQSLTRTLLLNGAHLAALSAFAIAQPLFDLLDDSADFFAVRGSPRWEIILFALAVVLVPPAALLVVEAVAALVSRALQQTLHLAFVAGLVGVLALQLLKRGTSLTSTEALIGLALALGVAVALLYQRFAPFRSFLTIVSPAPFVFLVLFLLVSPVSELTLARGAELRLANVEARSPVVMVVFDEFPVTGLLDANGRIDAKRFPNFARLAGDSMWFRNTTTVSAGTTRAVPAILTGKYARTGHPPVFAEHPENIFTLLGADYRLNVRESATHLCPKQLCEREENEAPQAVEPAPLLSDVGIAYLHLLAPPRLEESLPPITSEWMNFGSETEVTDDLIAEAMAAAKPTRRAPAKPMKEPTPQERAERLERRRQQFYDPRGQSFTDFVASLRPSSRPSLNFLHVGLPHLPWRYFPSGKQSAVSLVARPDWLLLYRRHLLQVGFADRLLGDMLDRLEETGMYDRSLVVVTADHGISFGPAGPQRGTTRDNLQDLAFVPLFVKRPGQEEGVVRDYHMQTVEIVPTIADILGVEIPWKVDGRSALTDPQRPDVHMAHILRLSSYRPPEVSPYAPLLERQKAALVRKLELVGDGTWTSVFVSDRYRELIGRSVATVPLTGSSSDRAEITDKATRTVLANYDPALPFVPSPIPGAVSGEGAAVGKTLAVAVNGTIAALATTYDYNGAVNFAALAPESAFRRGRNEIDVYWLEGADAATARLTRLEGP